jgi:hypothetical protein
MINGSRICGREILPREQWSSNPGDSVTAGDSINADHPEDTDAPVYPATVTDADLSRDCDANHHVMLTDPTGETVGQATDHLDFIRTAIGNLCS